MFATALLATSFTALSAAAQGTAASSSSSATSIGTSAPDFNLPGADGKNHALGDYARAKVLAIVFQSDTCPVSSLYESRIRKLSADYKDKGVEVVAINPNNPGAIREEDEAYSDSGDSLEDMKARADYRHIDWPYLSDGERQAVAAKLQPSVTPEIFIFDQDRKLRYEGRIDDNIQDASVKSSDARNALEALLAGQSVPIATTEARGCPVGWKTQGGLAAGATAAPKQGGPLVSVALVGKEDLANLRNNPTGKYLLLNFWATWCGPCVGEFPDLEATYRMYRGRGLDFITVSENDPEEKAAVLEFLQKQHATGRNLLFASADVYAMQAAFDPATPGAVPFTLLLAPNGDVLYQQVGDLDTLKLRRAILANLPDSAEYPGEQQYWSSDSDAK